MIRVLALLTHRKELASACAASKSREYFENAKCEPCRRDVLRVHVTYSIKAFAFGTALFGELGLKGQGSQKHQTSQT